VRDLARNEGKQVELFTRGEDTELDRNIIEELADPLMHMIRNGINHGLETPAERERAGKPPVGRVQLSAWHQSGFIMIELSDDGRGIPREKVLSKARERGLVAEGAELTDTEVQNLIFEPGFSTADTVSNVSGRGVGMDVVKRNITKLRGRVDVSSVEGQGTRFTLKMPLTLAIIDGLVVGVGKERYIVPIYTVREMLRPTKDQLSSLHNREEMVSVRGGLLPMVRLYRCFDVAPRSEDPTQGLLLVVETLGKRFCLLVDELIGKQEVVIKSLGESLKRISGVAGGAILGDGTVGLILDMDGIFSGGSDG
jgi:two-component system chemotaxis sensor kinase CheA